MNSTLKRRLITYVIDEAPNRQTPFFAGSNLLEAVCPGSSERVLRSIAVELHDKEALVLKSFNDEPLNFFVRPGRLIEKWLQGALNTKGLAMEILEFLYEQSEEGKNRVDFGRVADVLQDISFNKVQHACHWLVEKKAAKISGANGGVILFVMILPRGRDIIEGTPEENRVDIHHGDRYHIQNVQNSPIAINSEHINQVLQVGSEVPYGQVSEIIRAALASLPSFGFPDNTEKRIRSYLDAAATAVEDDEPDIEHAESSLNKALASAAIHADQATKLGTALAPLIPWFAALSLYVT